MPQPLPSRKSISFEFRPDSASKRPHLAPYIVGILAYWNEMESRMGVLLAALLGGEARTVIKIYLALQTDGGRKAIVDTVTQLKLRPDELVRFQEIQKEISGRYSERNKAVHGAWGVSPEYPDDLLWYDPRESVGRFPGLISASGIIDRKLLLDDLRTTIRIYTKRDFEDVTARFKSTQEALETFTKPYVAPLFEAMPKSR